MDNFQKIKRVIESLVGIKLEDGFWNRNCKEKILNLMKEHNISSELELLKKFNEDSFLKQKIFSIVTINETYFFREEHQFRTLVKHIIPILDAELPSTQRITILSAPCSTGEEVYSLAIFLLENCKILDRRDISILGIDIDYYAINKAKLGIYNKRSIHKMPSTLIEKYFDIEKEGYYKVKDFLKNSVSFMVANIFDKEKLAKFGQFDVIFSRNMLIYFSKEKQIEALTIFKNLLRKGGFLFLGHAEKVPSDFEGFIRKKFDETFVYQKI